jgi:hypothetical protein
MEKTKMSARGGSASGGKKTKKMLYAVVTLMSLCFTFMQGKLALAQATPSSGTGWDPSTLDKFGLPSGSVSGIITNGLFWILTIFGLLAVIGFVISGVMYIVSAGSEDTMKTAKRAMIYSIVGVLVALSGLVIIYAITGLLDGINPNF